MAEFLNWKAQKNKVVPTRPTTGDSGIDAMGKPVPLFRRTNGLQHCKVMGLDSKQAWECVGAMSEQLERDEPYEAMAAGMRFLDLTGTYRLMAVLLASEECHGVQDHALPAPSRRRRPRR